MKTNKQKQNNHRLLWSFVLVVLALLVVVSLSIYLQIGRLSHSAMEHAGEAVRQTEVQFHQLIDSSIRQMKIASGSIAEDDLQNQEVLRSLVENGNFTDAALVSNGLQTDLQGNVTAMENASSYAIYVFEDVEVKLSWDENSIQMRYPASDTAEIVAALDIHQLHDLLGNAYDGDCAYALYNIATGSYLINATPFTDGGYYDALLALNHRGSTEVLMQNSTAQAHITRSTVLEGRYFIAQQRTSVRSWGITLLIPEDRLIDRSSHPQSILILMGLVLLMLVACIVYCAISFRKAIYSERAQQADKARMAEQQIRQAADTSRSTIYCYNRKENRIASFHDGMKIYNESAMPAALHDLADICGLDASDADHLEELVRELPAGEKAQMISFVSTKDDEKMLLFTLNSTKENSDMIFGSIRDCTLEHQNHNRALDEQNFHKLMIKKAASIWQINVTRNRWRLTDSMQGYSAAKMGIRNKNWREYDSDLNGCVREFIHPEDFNSYAELLNRSALTEAYLSGRQELIADYKTRASGKQEAEWHRQIVHLFADTNSGHIMANLYVLNVDAEKNAAIERGERKRILQQTLTALGSIYSGLYYVDLDHGLCYTAKSQGGELVTQLCSPYKSTFDAYANSSVHPDDRAAFQRMLDAYHIRKSITEDSHLARLEYRRLVGEEYQWAAAVIQAARFENGTIREVIIALRSIEQEKKAGHGWM